MEEWSGWAPFPDPRKKEFISAPIGPGVYELRLRDTLQPVLLGSGKNCAYRMASLLPAPYGQGTRENERKRKYVLRNLTRLEYRCCPCATEAEARSLEARRKAETPFLFST